MKTVISISQAAYALRDGKRVPATVRWGVKAGWLSRGIVTEATQFVAGLYAHSHMITDLRNCHQVTRMP